MYYKILLLAIILLTGLRINTLGQVRSLGQFKISEEPKGKSDSILIKKITMNACNDGTLIIGYRLGSGKRIKEVVLNKKKYTNFFLDTIRNGGHSQGILAIPLGKINETTASDILLLLNDKASVRGAVAQLYENVHQDKPFIIAKKSIPDTTDAIKVQVLNTEKDHVIFDLLSGKSKRQRNIDAQVGKQQKILIKPRNIRPNPSKKSGLLLMASVSYSTKKKVNLEWSLEKKLINILYQAIIIQASTRSN